MDKANDYHWKVLVTFLEQIARQKGITQGQIAEFTGMKQQSIARVFSLKFVPKLHTFLSIAGAVGVNFFFEDKDGTSDLTKGSEAAMEKLGRRPDKLPKN